MQNIPDARTAWTESNWVIMLGDKNKQFYIKTLGTVIYNCMIEMEF